MRFFIFCWLAPTVKVVMEMAWEKEFNGLIVPKYFAVQLFWFFSVFCDFKRAASSKDLATALIFIRSTGEAMEARLFYVVLGSMSRRQQSLEESSSLIWEYLRKSQTRRGTLQIRWFVAPLLDHWLLHLAKYDKNWKRWNFLFNVWDNFVVENWQMMKQKSVTN